MATSGMRCFEFLIVPALAGLVAGVAHGIVAHQAELPVGLAEQVYQLVEADQISVQ